jgi:hypothetical protein
LLTNPQNPLLNSASLVDVFARGIALWARIGVEYLALDPRQTRGTALLLMLGAALLCVGIVAVRRSAGWASREFGVIAALLIVILLPGPVQAPVVAVSTSDLGPDTFWFNLVGESRLYHLSLAGLVAALMLLSAPAATASAAADTAIRRRHSSSRIVLAALVVLLVAWAPASHRLAHDYARHTRAQIAPLAAAHAAIARLQLPARRCQIYLLDAGPIWGLLDIGDPIIKASSPAPHALDHCLIDTERTPWGNFVRSGSIGPDDYAPLRPLRNEGKPIPWLDIGGFEAVYLNLDADMQAQSIDGAFFLEYRNGEFVDVSAAVRSGARPVHFYNARPQQK